MQTDIKQLLPVTIYQAATDPLSLRTLATAANPFATLADLTGGALTLAQVLANGNLTNELDITSNNGFSSLLVRNAFNQMQFLNGNVSSYLNMSPTQTSITFLDNISADYSDIILTGTELTLVHTVEIDITAPIINIPSIGIDTIVYTATATGTLTAVTIGAGISFVAGTLSATGGAGVTSVSGTLNRITSTGGATPIIDIAATYVGQTSITTLGTVTTGTWNGTLISPTFGGTGINNGANTLTFTGVTSITGGGTIALGGFTATVPATGTVTLGSPGSSGRVFVGSSATTGAGSSTLTYISNILTNTVSANSDVTIRVINGNAGANARAVTQSTDGSNSVLMVQHSSGYTTSGLLVANLGMIYSSNTVGMLYVNNAASTYHKWAIGGTAASNEVMRLTTTGLGILTLADANSSLQVNGSLSLKYRAIAATDTFTATDHTIDATTGTFTVNFPTAVGITGRIYILKNSGVGVITADAAGTETIDGQLTQAIPAGSAMMIQSNGANWIII